jgi:hypothetical protein
MERREMFTLQVEHAISDFDVWKRAFEGDPVRRRESGVRRYRVLRPVDDPRYVKIDLEFDSLDEAEAFRNSLQDLWGSGRAPALAGTPQTRIVEQVLGEAL